MDGIQRTQHAGADLHRRGNDRIDTEKMQASQDAAGDRDGAGTEPASRARKLDDGSRLETRRGRRSNSRRNAAVSASTAIKLDQRRGVQIRDARTTGRHDPARRPAEGRAQAPTPPSPAPQDRGPTARCRADRRSQPTRSTRQARAEPEAQAVRDARPQPKYDHTRTGQRIRSRQAVSVFSTRPAFAEGSIPPPLVARTQWRCGTDTRPVLLDACGREQFNGPVVNDQRFIELSDQQLKDRLVGDLDLAAGQVDAMRAELVRRLRSNHEGDLGEPPNLAGVREPRRPSPSGSSGSAAAPERPDWLTRGER
jgi:hypothetical protein